MRGKRAVRYSAAWQYSHVLLVLVGDAALARHRAHPVAVARPDGVIVRVLRQVGRELRPRHAAAAARRVQAGPVHVGQHVVVHQVGALPGCSAGRGVFGKWQDGAEGWGGDGFNAQTKMGEKPKGNVDGMAGRNRRHGGDRIVARWRKETSRGRKQIRFEQNNNLKWKRNAEQVKSGEEETVKEKTLLERSVQNNVGVKKRATECGRC